MVSLRLAGVAALLLLLLPSPAQSFTDVTVAATVAYVAPETLPPQLLNTPPAEGSGVWKSEIEAMRGFQSNILPDDRKAMQSEQAFNIDLITPVLGKDFTRERLPLTFGLLDKIFKDTRRIVEADKKFWHMRRPYLADPHITLLIDPLDDSPSYPSGHACVVRVLGEVLGLLYPDRLADLRNRAEDVGWHRIQSGVHYPTDIAAGQSLASLVIGALLQTPAFRQDLEAARQEIAKAK
ncbi:MAG: phosphatase PAP2 family protein [Pseudomonadota bacterium]|nr:phosphatase PAP2 family protein [Pseudomonadota bacterium]